MKNITVLCGQNLFLYEHSTGALKIILLQYQSNAKSLAFRDRLHRGNASHLAIQCRQPYRSLSKNINSYPANVENMVSSY